MCLRHSLVLLSAYGCMLGSDIPASRVKGCGRQENISVQHDSVASVGSDFKSLTLRSSFQVYLSTAQNDGNFHSGN